MAKSKEPELYDILILGGDTSRKIADGAAAALIRDLATTRVAVPVEEALHKDWVEVYFEPGASGHVPFVIGSWTSDQPAFKEAVVRWGDQQVVFGDGDSAWGTYFYLQFYGCQFKQPLGEFRKRFEKVMYGRCAVHSHPHKGVPERKEVAPEDAREGSKRRKQTGNPSGLAGTHVEEL